MILHSDKIVNGSQNCKEIKGFCGISTHHVSDNQDKTPTPTTRISDSVSFLLLYRNIVELNFLLFMYI